MTYKGITEHFLKNQYVFNITDIVHIIKIIWNIGKNM